MLPTSAGPARDRSAPAALRRGRLTVAGLALGCALGGIAVPAQAQEAVRRGDFQVAVDIGATAFGTVDARGSGTRMSFSGGWFLTRRLEAEADITCLGGTERASPNATFTLCTGSLGAVLDLRANGRLVPYLRVSVGESQLDLGASAGVYDIDARRFAVEAGTGARYYLGAKRRFAMRMDARFLRTAAFGGLATHFSAGLGITYRIGKDR